jgi:hypothetical protein
MYHQRSGKAIESSEECLEEVNKETHWEKHLRRSHAGCDKISSRTSELIFKRMEIIFLVDYCCRSKPTGEQCLNNTRCREAHVATDGAP